MAARGRQEVQRFEPRQAQALTGSGDLMSDSEHALLLKRMQLARAMPRDDEAARRRLKMQAAGKTEEWGYSWNVKKKGGGTAVVEGPSIKCANAVLGAVDNIDVRVSVVETEEAWFFSVAVIDLERNSAPTRTFRQRRTADMGDKYDPDRVQDMLFALGQSKAIRNAVVNYLAELCDFAWQESRKALLASIAKDRKTYLKRIHERLDALNVSTERVVRWIGRGEKSWTDEDLARISGALTAVVEGVTRADTIWPEEAPPAPPPPRKGNPRPEPEPDPPAPEAGESEDSKLL